ncbi:hypothetical protein [Yersinia massiliensis]|uniref:Uncharacterized protein n=1 Tax=Yersinia massiliensis TaxID=419257 RepID=A0ABM6UUT1_9GAMM|nr:hypothetical protein [Yersinia massiliensis]AVX39029.1 hypothetical protein DA391_15935 [Yersinia massiliensis]
MKNIIAHIFLSMCLLYPTTKVLFFDKSYMSGGDIIFVSIAFIAGLIFTAMLPMHIKELLKRTTY